jgi:hypothetical protein
MCEIGVAHACTYPNATVREMFDPIEPWQAINVDKTHGAGDAALHQVEEIGAGGEIGSTRLGGGRNGLGNRRGTDIIEIVHAACSRSK